MPAQSNYGETWINPATGIPLFYIADGGGIGVGNVQIADVNGNLTAPTLWSQSQGKDCLTVSSVGLATGASIVNGGASFGPDNGGIAAAVAVAGVAGNPSKIFILAGTYAISNYVPVTTSYLDIELDPEAVLVIPATPGWYVYVNSANVEMAPVFVIGSSTGVTDVRIHGGQIVQTSPSTDATGTGVLIGPNTSRIHVDHMYFKTVQRWPIFVNGYVNGVAGNWSYIYEDHNTFDTCGNLTLPDGGGVRLANNVSTAPVTYTNGIPSCPHHFYSSYSRALNTQIFGWDCSNPTTGPLQYLFFEGDTVTSSVASSGNQVIGFFLENCNLAAGNSLLYGTQHVRFSRCDTIGCFMGFAAMGNEYDVVYEGCVAAFSVNTGFQCGCTDGSQVGDTRKVRYIGCTAKDNSANGFMVGSIIAGCTVDDVILDDWEAYNDTGTAQAYGVEVRTLSAAVTVSNVYIGKGDGAGCATGAVLIAAKGSGTYTNVEVDSRIIGTVTNNGSAGSASNLQETTYPG